MKWGLIGYGSIGKRHADNIISLKDDVVIVSNNPNCLLPKANAIDELIKTHMPDAILICNETSLHEKAYKELRALSETIPLLIEKPIFDKRYSYTSDAFSHVAYCLRFHPLVIKLKEILKNSTIIAGNFYVGQYLPTWRVERDYKTTYSAKKDLGGGVLRDLSHEIDLATYLFGELELKFCKTGHISHLEITSDDFFAGSFTSKTGAHVSIEMNYLDRIIQRYCIIHTNELTIKVDFIKSEIVTNQHIEKFTFDKNEMYLNMLKSMKNKNYKDFAGFDEGLKILDIISQAEQMVEK